MKSRKNIVGPKIRQLRYEQKLTQSQLAARVGRLGWDISRGTLSQIEAQIRCVTDYELICLTKALGVTAESLLPPQSQITKTIAVFFPERPLD